jgi:hypothetical protein
MLDRQGRGGDERWIGRKHQYLVSVLSMKVSEVDSVARV